MYTVEYLKSKFVSNVLSSFHHKHYNHVVNKARMYRQWVTGKDQGELIVRYKERETDEQKEQRIKITNSVTKYVSSQIRNVYDEIERADNAHENIMYSDNVSEGPAYITELLDHLEQFTEDEDLAKYLHRSLKFLNFVDPNSFLILEFKSNEDEREVYPVTAYSDQVMDYDYTHKDLQYLHIKLKGVKRIKTKQGVKSEPAEDHYFYSPDVSYRMRELGKPGEYIMPDDLKEDHDIISKGDKDNEVHYALEAFIHVTGMTPAVQVGYIPDDETNHETKVSILDSAEEIYNELINIKSEYDLSMAMHGFYKVYAYGNECRHTQTVDGERYACNGGYIAGRECPKCEGVGTIMPVSVQDVIMVDNPRDKEEHIPLSERIHYVNIPENIID